MVGVFTYTQISVFTLVLGCLWNDLQLWVKRGTPNCCLHMPCVLSRQRWPSYCCVLTGDCVRPQEVVNGGVY